MEDVIGSVVDTIRGLASQPGYGASMTKVCIFRSSVGYGACGWPLKCLELLGAVSVEHQLHQIDIDEKRRRATR